MILVAKILLSLTIAGAGLYVLTHVKSLASRMQNAYVKSAEEKQKEGGFSSYLSMYNPETWKTPFMTFIFRFGVVFLGILLLLSAYPTVFGAIVL